MRGSSEMSSSTLRRLYAAPSTDIHCYAARRLDIRGHNLYWEQRIPAINSTPCFYQQPGLALVAHRVPLFPHNKHALHVWTDKAKQSRLAQPSQIKQLRLFLSNCLSLFYHQQHLLAVPAKIWINLCLYSIHSSSSALSAS